MMNTPDPSTGRFDPRSIGFEELWRETEECRRGNSFQASCAAAVRRISPVRDENGRKRSAKDSTTFTFTFFSSETKAVRYFRKRKRRWYSDNFENENIRSITVETHQNDI
jgi:hypothetical protein